VEFQNGTAGRVDEQLRFQLWQVASATAAPLDLPQPSKRLEMLPGQTILEWVPARFPSVRIPSRFLLRWQTGGGQVLGHSEVMVLPRAVLRELNELSGGKPIGLWDPGDRIRPALAEAGVLSLDLSTVEPSPQLCRFGLVAQKDNGDEDNSKLTVRLQRWLKAGVHLVWFKPQERDDETGLVRQEVHPGHGTLVIAQAEGEPTLTENPAGQWRLLALARLALETSSPIRLETDP
jgi:hypothetical protein